MGHSAPQYCADYNEYYALSTVRWEKAVNGIAPGLIYFPVSAVI
jgi:hypothetical protein